MLGTIRDDIVLVDKDSSSKSSMTAAVEKDDDDIRRRMLSVRHEVVSPHWGTNTVVGVLVVVLLAVEACSNCTDLRIQGEPIDTFSEG